MTTKERTLYGDISEAYAADPSKADIYEFRYKVVDLSDLVASHDENLNINSKYPQELQPRLRDRAASKTQVENIARNLNARALLHDTGFIDTGPMIVGIDNVVESGNGRVLGLRKAAEDYPQRYKLYKTMLINQADKYGLNESDIEDIKTPVLVRERVTDVNRVDFARAANVGAVMGMSPYEQAVTDAKKLKPEIISQLQVGEDQSIDQAIRMRANDHIVKHFISNIPENERATVADAAGQVNKQGMDRLKLALFTKTYTGEAGQRLARIFGESADPHIKAIENAMFQSLPDMAKAESLINAGEREKELSIAPDLAEVIDTYAGIKTSGITIKDYLAQQAMFEDRLNATQKDLLNHLDDIARKPKQMREFMKDTAQAIIEAPPKGQTSMLGFDPITKEGMIYGIINKQRKEKGLDIITPPTAASVSKGLEESDTGRIESAAGMARGMGTRDKADTGDSQQVMTAGSVQVGLAGMGKDTAQVKMFEEYGTAPGMGGTKQTLIDVEKEKAKEDAKPLPGQIDFMTGKTVEGVDVTDGVIIKKGQLVANPDNIPAAKELVKTLKEKADDAETLSKAVTPAKAKRLMQNARQARRDASKIESSILQQVQSKSASEKKEKSKDYTFEELMEIHESRSSQARAADEARKHSKVIDLDDTAGVKRWVKDPGSKDIKRIDTPKRKKKKRQTPPTALKSIRRK